jgi:outer membrane protein TolC
MEQPLYKGGMLVNGVKLSDSEIRLHEADYLDRKLKVAAVAIKAYYQALTAQVVVQQYETLLKYGEEDLREAQIRLKSGMETQMQILELTVKLLETQQRLSKARTNYQLELSTLRVLTGLEEGVSLSLAGHFPLEDIRDDLKNLLTEAQSNRLDLKSSKEDVTYNQLRTDIEKGKRLPQLSLIARYEWEDPTMFSGKKDWLVMLKGSISFGNSSVSYSEQRQQLYNNPFAFPNPPGVPGQDYYYPVRQWKLSVFDRSSNQVELEEARAARQLSQDRWFRLQRQVYHDVQDAHAQKADGVARMATAQKQISAADELVKITRTRYAVGYATLADLFKARASLAEAQVNLATAKDDQAVALGKLYWALSRELVFRGDGS